MFTNSRSEEADRFNSSSQQLDSEIIIKNSSSDMFKQIIWIHNKISHIFGNIDNIQENVEEMVGPSGIHIPMTYKNHSNPTHAISPTHIITFRSLI